jgi:hypothetical protein
VVTLMECSAYGTNIALFDTGSRVGMTTATRTITSTTTAGATRCASLTLSRLCPVFHVFAQPDVASLVSWICT